jgi:hypothetical protein
MVPSSQIDLAFRNFAASLPFAGNQPRDMVAPLEVPTRNPNAGLAAIDVADDKFNPVVAHGLEARRSIP